MKYYKIVIDREIKGVANSFNFFIEESNKLHSSTEIAGQFVEYEGKLYRDYWMQPTINNSRRIYYNATITEINSSDYFAFIKAKRTNEEIIIEDDDEPTPEPVIPEEIIEEPDAMLEYIRSSKINEMSHVCNQTIENGFDLEIKDGIYHFSLTPQDQLNLINFSVMVAQGIEQIPYHADGELCEFYSAAEITAIINEANIWKTYHTTYFNALKSYINSLETIEEISAITYGIEIPEAFKTDVLKILEY